MLTGAVSQPPRYYSFTSDWFSGHIPTWKTILNHVKPTRLLEIGCFEGRATTFLIEYCARFGQVAMTCVDTWEGAVDLSSEVMAGTESRFDENTRLALGASGVPVKFRKIKQASAKALPALIAEGAEFDFVYIDGSHTAPDVLTDAVDAFRLLRPGGVMIFDDYVWCMEKHGQEDSLNMPKPAIDAFVNTFQRRLLLLDYIGSQLSLIKTS